MILRMLGPQGMVGLAVALILTFLLGASLIEVRHWKKQSARFEQLYRAEVGVAAETVAAFRAATERARAADQAHAETVRRGQAAINDRSEHDLEARLAAARARASGPGRLLEPASARATRGSGRGTPVPRLPNASGSLAQAGGQDRLPAPAMTNGSILTSDDALIATEQAIQLDELINWVRAQAKVDIAPSER